MKQNYQLLMDQTITVLASEFPKEKPPRLLLHSCCGPCSSAVIHRLAKVFALTVFYYNPNIDTRDEYLIRAGEQSRLIQRFNTLNIFPHRIGYQMEKYQHDQFLAVAADYADCPEGGQRCECCLRLRIAATAQEAQLGGFDFFCTTLSVSPMKNAALINRIGMECSTDQCRWLPNDFKKKNGYLESIRISKEFGLYRQDYCGCEYSRRKTEHASKPCA
ncbi:MAG: epoxyqueuosine reductase QueH, partial [Treponema sp.]